ncbi:tetratricopeptide repeat protein, partial [Streptomyces sp. ME18-1-4]|nr:tetratricopeptide repeat protein [Streptomyces sp. ME18-1-4]
PLLPDDLVSESVFDPDSKPTPARGFDAVAEAVLGDDPRTLQGDGGCPALLGEQMARVNEAVRTGRIDAAAALAEQTVLEASGTLGPEHPEVLRLRELGAYIAYLAGDPLRAFHVSLDLARIRRSARDGEAAYGNVQSAAAAWRAVRDPVQGLNLGTELLGLWTELTAEEGPAAEDVEQLESARARMLRLAERARRSGA